MKKFLVVTAGVIGAAVLVFVIIVALQPAEYHVERSATIEAPPEVVFEQVDSFRNWENWSPWLDRDPDAEGSFDGPERGEGAIFEWSGNREIGAGRMTITESRAREYIEIKLEFFEPYESQTTTAFAFSETDNGATEVTWSMSGENNFISKAIALFVDFEEMVGQDYERGLVLLEEAAMAEAGLQEDTDEVSDGTDDDVIDEPDDEASDDLDDEEPDKR